MPTVDRVQTGVRLEKRTLKVLKALAEYHDISLGDLIEGVMLHAFEGKVAFSPATLAQIERLRAVYGLDLTAADSHLLVEHAEKSGSNGRATGSRSTRARGAKKRAS